MEKNDNLKSRIVKFFAGMVAVALVTGMIIISQKLSQDSLALLTGLSCGIAAMLPTLVLGVFVIRRDDQRRKDQEQRRLNQPVQPPVIVVTSGQLPGQGYPNYYGQQQPMIVDEEGWGHSRRSNRDFQMVGSED